MSLRGGPSLAYCLFPTLHAPRVLAWPLLTNQEPDGKAHPRQVAQFQHEADIEEDAQGWSQGHQGDLRVQGQG